MLAAHKSLNPTTQRWKPFVNCRPQDKNTCCTPSLAWFRASRNSSPSVARSPLRYWLAPTSKPISTGRASVVTTSASLRRKSWRHPSFNTKSTTRKFWQWYTVSKSGDAIWKYWRDLWQKTIKNTGYTLRLKTTYHTARPHGWKPFHANLYASITNQEPRPILPTPCAASTSAVLL